MYSQYIKSLLYEYTTSVIVVIILIILLICWYLVSYSNRTVAKIDAFEKKYIKYNNKQSYDFCSGPLATKTLSEFYISSSYMPYLVGFQKYDYSSISMVTKVIQYGARFIYVQVFAQGDNNPVLSSGNEMGTILNAQNSVNPIDLFKIIGKLAFSEKFVDNYTDPFIVFLDLRTNGNVEALNKLYAIIKSTCNHHLYQKVNTNLAQTRMCFLMKKLIILATDNYGGSDLTKIINMNTSSSYLKVFNSYELPTKEFISNPKEMPIISLTSSKLRFNKNKIQIEDDTNFINLKLSKSHVVRISGSKFNDNTDQLYEIIQITNNMLVLSDSIVFKDELSGSNVQLRFFNKSYKLLNLPKENKNALTVVIPEFDLFKMNYNPYDGFNLGCQFVCMNFQEPDKNLDMYMKKFKTFSVKQKPKHLINYFKAPKVPNLNSTVIPIGNMDIPVIYDFRFTYSNIRLQPLLHSNLRMVIKDNLPVISPNYTLDNSYFRIIEGLSGESGTISLLIGDKYLCSNEGCCWLSFQQHPPTKEQVSFFPIKSMDNAISLCQIKNDKKYYLKHRLGFNYKTQLYSKLTNSYTLITSFNDNQNEIVNVYEPVSQNDFKCFGQILVPQSKADSLQTIYSKLIKGACAYPIDFELIYKSNNSQYIWKMVPREGFVALGNIVTTSRIKPRKTKYYTVAFDYINQSELGNKVWNTPKDVNLKPMSLWNSLDNAYFIAYNSTEKNKRPNRFAYPIYTINTDPKTYNERLYMNSVKSNELETAAFMVTDEPTQIAENIPIKYSSVKENKEDFRILNMTTENVMAIDKSLWSNFNPTYESDAIEPEAVITATNTSENDFSNSWIYYRLDSTIRLKGNNKYGLTINSDTVYIDEINAANLPNQQLQYTNDNRLIFNINSKCIYEQDNVLKIGECNESSNANKWIISQHPVNKCINVNNFVYVKRKVKKGIFNFFNTKSDYTNTYNVLRQPIDDNYFYVYVYGQVTKINTETYTVELKGNLGFIEVDKLSNEIILFNTSLKSEMRKGSKVLCRNGGLLVDGYEESNVRWEATVVDILGDNKLVVLFDMNTLEANLNRASMGRPRKNEEKIININDVILKKSYVSCT